MDTEPENDPTWELLGNASKQKASPMFSRDVMRAIRLEEDAAPPWWKRFLSPAPIIGTLATATACVAIIFATRTSEVSTSPEVAQTDSSEANFEEIVAYFETNEELDDVISPISLLASNDADFQSYEAYLDF